jgi:hypothetical protein
MKKHGLSAQGLKSLMGKLLNAGLITQKELSNRGNASSVANPKPPKLPAKQIAADLQAGVTDDQIVKKYGIPAAKLPTLYTKLVGVGLLSQADLDRRSKAFEETVDLDPEAATFEAVSGSSQEKAKDILAEFAARFKISQEDLERLKTASITDLKEILDKYDIPQEEATKLLKAYGSHAGVVVSEAKQQLIGSLKELMSAARAEGDEDAKKAALEKVPFKPLLIAAAALMLGWFLANVFTSGWGLFLVLFVIFTAASFVGAFFLTEKSIFRSKISAQHLTVVILVLIALNVVLSLNLLGMSHGGALSFHEIRTEFDEIANRLMQELAQSEGKGWGDMMVKHKIEFEDKWFNEYRGKEVSWEGVVKGFKDGTPLLVLISMDGKSVDTPPDRKSDVWLSVSKPELIKKASKYKAGDDIYFKAKLWDEPNLKRILTVLATSL